MSGINWSRLRRAYEIVSAHRDQLDLGDWVHECGTLACAAGWCGLDPEFQKKGLVADIEYGIKCIRGDIVFYSYGAVGVFFGLNPDQTTELFGPRRDSSALPPVGTDFEVWQFRMLRFFRDHNQFL